MTEFSKILTEIQAEHDKKSEQYGRPGQPFWNVKQGGALIGVQWWRAALLRIGDKTGRLQSTCEKGEFDAPWIRQEFIETATYAAIAAALIDETTTSVPEPQPENHYHVWWPVYGTSNHYRCWGCGKVY